MPNRRKGDRDEEDLEEGRAILEREVEACHHQCTNICSFNGCNCKCGEFHGQASDDESEDF